MFGISPESRFTPCVECGAWVPHGTTEEHVCDGERVLDFRIFQLRGEIAAFDAQLAVWLSTARGRFAAWIAERDRLAGEASAYPRSVGQQRRGEAQALFPARLLWSSLSPKRRAAGRALLFAEAKAVRQAAERVAKPCTSHVDLGGIG